MTREEAINILDDYDVNFDGHTAEEIAEAFDMAFKALEQEPILDKIRAEIEKIEVSGYIDMNTLFLKDGQAVKECALDIIDKYKVESEGK